MARDPQAVAANWAQKLGSSSQKIADGVNAVTVAPGLSAARQKEVWAQNTLNSKDKWAARTAAVPLSDWQNAMITKGAPRIASGAAAAQPKFATFMAKFLPFMDSAVAGLPPRGDLEANIGRMTALVRKTSTFKN